MSQKSILALSRMIGNRRNLFRLALAICLLSASIYATHAVYSRPLVSSLSISDSSVTEGDGAGTVNMDFTVTLSPANPTQTVTVDFATGDFFSPIATAGVDYVAQSGTLTFNPGDTTKTISIVVNKDCVSEPSENLAVFLSNPINATLSNTRANGQITTDDGRSIIISDTTMTEGDGAGTVNMDFTVTLSGSPVTASSVAACGAVTVDFATGDFFSPIATAGVDYVAQSGTVTFNAGETIKTISIVVNKDCVPEPSENLAVFLSNPVGATLSNTRANGQITTDDQRSISISDPSVSEGAGVNANLDFTVTLTGSPVTTASVAACGPVTVDLATGDFFSPVATAGVDYVAKSATVTFNAGETTKTFSVVVLPDCITEPSEFLAVFASNPVNATLGTTRANGTIIDNATSCLTVTNTNDSGNGSLRQALANANVNSDGNVINFNFAGAGPFTITPATPLPTIVNPITIDGYTQPGSALNTNIAGSNAVLLIELDGSSPGAAGNGLNINASNCVVRGLVINRFTQSGINLNGSSNNLIEGNFIGTDTAGTANRGNGQYGIFNNGGSGNTIGGAGAASRNLVAFNGLAGIFIAGGLNNQIRGNNIFNNGGLGIDLAPNGVTPNDPGDPDTGANNLQNFPAITAIGRSGSGSASPDNSSGGNSSTTVHGTLNSTPNQSFTIDFYNNPACDALNNGEGKTYLGSAMTTTDGSGDASFTVVLPATVPGTVITATATDPTGNTSEFSSCNLPTAAPAGISGQVTNASGAPLGGVAITLTGNNQVRRAISDSQGFYAFREVAIDDFYTITPRLANYAFTPAERSFSLVGNKTDAAFTGTPDSLPNANPLDSEMFFVRQQYLDFLGREPEQGGLDYWTAELDQCRGDIACLNSRRVGVSAAFFMEREYQDTGSFVYRLYQASAARRPTFKQFITDSRQVIGGPGLEQSKTAFVQSWVQRPEFKAAYPDSMTNAEFVNKLCDTAGIAESSARDSYLEALNNGATRAVVLGQLIENAQFKAREYNPSFVLMQYFGYLKRDPEQSGYNFWLNVLNNQPNNYRGMVCSFITSAEYQLRFSSVVTHGNAECR
ncbi:MAG: alkaline phosphatase [Acidobacteria bacterium]|nr:alkaline phosphatase [Acidobacteriota bacterium]